MLKKILVVILVLIAGVLLFASTKPDTFRVERSTIIKAPSDRIFGMIDDFHSWGAWSPWEKRDSAMKRTFSGPASGKGAVYEWAGNAQVGQGRMEILDVTPLARLVIRLDFIKPLEGHDTAEFRLASRGDSTKVTWAINGPVPYVGKIIHVFFNMDKMIGTDFETGLANLKTNAEK